MEANTAKDAVGLAPAKLAQPETQFINRTHDYQAEGANMDELITRLEQAEKRLLTMAEEKPIKSDRIRLQGKAEGVRLALSYAREMT